MMISDMASEEAILIRNRIHLGKVNRSLSRLLIHGVEIILMS